MSAAGHDPSHHELREATLSGVRSVAGARIGIEVVVFAASIALARLIAPEQFGEAVIALIVVALASTLMPLTLGARLVQRKRVDSTQVAATTWLALVGGAGMALLAYFAGPWIASPLFGRATADLMGIAALAFVPAAFSVTPRALLQRRLDFR